MIRGVLTVAYTIVLMVVLAVAWLIYTVFRREEDASSAPILPEVKGKKWDADKHHHDEHEAPVTAEDETTAEPVSTAAEVEPETPAAPAAAKDDLKRIEGIGPVMERVLNEAGIFTFAELAARTPEELQAILDAAGVRRITSPETWPEQAKLAAEGRWDELAALQDTLKGGRRVT